MVATKIVDSAQKSVGAARAFVLAQVTAQVREFGGNLQATSGRLSSVATELRGDPLASPVAPLFDQGQRAVERAATYLSVTEVERIAVDLESFSRSRPITATLVATLVGFTVSRAVKASSVRRFDAAQNGEGA